MQDAVYLFAAPSPVSELKLLAFRNPKSISSSFTFYLIDLSLYRFCPSIAFEVESLILPWPGCAQIT